MKGIVMQVMGLHIGGKLDGEPIPPEDLRILSRRLLREARETSHKEDGWEGSVLGFLLNRQDALSEERECRFCVGQDPRPKFGEGRCRHREGIRTFLRFHDLDLVELTYRVGLRKVLMDLRRFDKERDAKSLQELGELFHKFLAAVVMSRPELTRQQCLTEAADQFQRMLARAAAKGGWKARWRDDGIRIEDDRLLDVIATATCTVAEARIGLDQSELQGSTREDGMYERIVGGLRSAWEWAGKACGWIADKADKALDVVIWPVWEGHVAFWTLVEGRFPGWWRTALAVVTLPTTLAIFAISLLVFLGLLAWGFLERLFGPEPKAAQA